MSLAILVDLVSLNLSLHDNLLNHEVHQLIDFASWLVLSRFIHNEQRVYSQLLSDVSRFVRPNSRKRLLVLVSVVVNEYEGSVIMRHDLRHLLVKIVKRIE